MNYHQTREGRFNAVFKMLDFIIDGDYQKENIEVCDYFGPPVKGILRVSIYLLLCISYDGNFCFRSSSERRSSIKLLKISQNFRQSKAKMD